MKILALYSYSNHLETLAELAWRYSSQIAVNRHVVFLEVAKSKELYEPFEIVRHIEQSCKELEIPLRWALGKSPAEAYAFLVYGTTEKNKLPLEALQNYLDPFEKNEIPTNNNQPVGKMIEALYKLGYKNFSDLERIPRSGVTSRFGAAGLMALQNAEDLEEPAWPLWKPVEIIEENQTFDPDQRIQSVETLGFILRPLLERLMARLTWRHEALTQLQLSLHLEPFTVVKETVRTWSFTFSFPQTQVASVLAILKEKLDFELQFKPLESSVVFFAMKVLDKTPLPDRQKDFFSKKEENQEMEAALIGRLHQKLGEKAVFSAATFESYAPEKSWAPYAGDIAPTQIEQTLVKTKLPLRPLRLLKKPRPLRKLGKYLILDGKKYQVNSWQGPERLVSEWWIDPFARQYWMVELEENIRWWVYSDFSKPPHENLFLHGIYD